MIQKITEYLNEQLELNQAALKSYDFNENLIQDADIEIRKMREVEAIKLRDRIHELNRHIAVIKILISPNGLI